MGQIRNPRVPHTTYGLCQYKLLRSFKVSIFSLKVLLWTPHGLMDASLLGLMLTPQLNFINSFFKCCLENLVFNQSGTPCHSQNWKFFTGFLRWIRWRYHVEESTGRWIGVLIVCRVTMLGVPEYTVGYVFWNLSTASEWLLLPFVGPAFIEIVSYAAWNIWK